MSELIEDDSRAQTVGEFDGLVRQVARLLDPGLPDERGGQEHPGERLTPHPAARPLGDVVVEDAKSGRDVTEAKQAARRLDIERGAVEWTQPFGGCRCGLREGGLSPPKGSVAVGGETRCGEAACLQGEKAGAYQSTGLLLSGGPEPVVGM